MPNTDFNGDGRDDILWRERDTGTLGNWLAGEGGTFIDNSANSLVGVPNYWNVVGTGDFNGDGNDDILWLGSGGWLGTWLGQDNGGWSINPGLINISEISAQVVGIGDFDGDGDDEVLILRAGSVTLDVLFTTPDGHLYDDDGVFGAIPAGWEVRGTGDFNGDGNDDLLLRHTDGTITTWLAHIGFGTSGRGFVSHDASIYHVGQDWQLGHIGDYNGDGYDDLLWSGYGNIGNWLGGPGGTFTVNNASLVVSPVDFYIAAVGDFDGNGVDDLLWRHWDTGQIRTWSGTETGQFVVNPGSIEVTNNWLVVPDHALRGEWDY